MRPRLLTIASVISLLFCLATIVLWVRSYWRGNVLLWLGGTWTNTESSRTDIELASGSGYLRFTCSREHNFGPGYLPYNSEFDALGWKYWQYDQPFNVWLNVDPKPFCCGFGGRWDSWDDKSKGHGGIL